MCTCNRRFLVAAASWHRFPQMSGVCLRKWNVANQCPDKVHDLDSDLMLKPPVLPSRHLQVHNVKVIGKPPTQLQQILSVKQTCSGVFVPVAHFLFPIIRPQWSLKFLFLFCETSVCRCKCMNRKWGWGCINKFILGYQVSFSTSVHLSTWELPTSSCM